MTAAIVLACACAAVFAVSLIAMLSKGRNAVVGEAARELQLHDHGTSARGKYRGFRFVIDAGSAEELRYASASAYGSFLSSAMSAAERMFRALGATFGIGRRNKVSLRMRVELRKAGDPAFNASSAAARIRRFLAEKLPRGSFRATSEETEVAVFLHELSPDDPASGAALVKELADRLIEAGEALKSGGGGDSPPPAAPAGSEA